MEPDLLSLTWCLGQAERNVEATTEAGHSYIAMDTKLNKSYCSLSCLVLVSTNSRSLGKANEGILQK